MLHDMLPWFGAARFRADRRRAGFAFAPGRRRLTFPLLWCKYSGK